MIANCIQGDIPTLDCVAAFTVGPKLAAMNVSMAICTGFAYVLKDQAGMTLRASNLLVHAAQRVTGFVVVEFRVRSDGLPTRVRMAILTRCGNWPMGIGHLGLRNLWRWFGVGRGLLDRHAC
jgi:hypothetical protein